MIAAIWAWVELGGMLGPIPGLAGGRASESLALIGANGESEVALKSSAKGVGH